MWISFSSEREMPGGSKNKTKQKQRKETREVKVKDDLLNLEITHGANHQGLTDDVELDDLLGMEGADADGADVGAIVSNLQPAQGHRGIALGHQACGVHVCARSTFTCWRREAAHRGASGRSQNTALTSMCSFSIWLSDHQWIPCQWSDLSFI